MKDSVQELALFSDEEFMKEAYLMIFLREAGEEDPQSPIPNFLIF